MAIELKMPKQGQSVESCVITAWHKKKGDFVNQGDLLYSYETDKASFDEESSAEGYLIEVLYNAGDEVQVLMPICYIGEKDEKIKANKQPAIHEETLAANDAYGNREQQAEIAEENSATGEVKISPRARKLAEKNHINYSAIKGSGPRRRIIESDIAKLVVNKSKTTPLARKIAEVEKMDLPVTGSGYHGRILKDDVINTPAGDTDFELKGLSNLRKIIASRMLKSIQNTAQLTLHSGADARHIISLRKAFKTESVDITISDMICYAVVIALLCNREINAHLAGDTLKIFKGVHLGIAVDTPRGLMVPVIKNADYLSLQELSARTKSLAASCQQGNIDPSLLEGGSFTVTNLGTMGIDYFTPVLNAPQIAILGVGSIMQKPVEQGDGTVRFIPTLALSLTFDHRATDGANAARFLQEITKQLQKINK